MLRLIFSLFIPNPVKNLLHVQTTGKVSLTEQSGKILLTKTIIDGEISIENLSSGIYYLKNNSTGSVQKVIIEK